MHKRRGASLNARRSEGKRLRADARARHAPTDGDEAWFGATTGAERECAAFAHYSRLGGRAHRCCSICQARTGGAEGDRSPERD